MQYDWKTEKNLGGCELLALKQCAIPSEIREKTHSRNIPPVRAEHLLSVTSYDVDDALQHQRQVFFCNFLLSVCSLFQLHRPNFLLESLKDTSASIVVDENDFLLAEDAADWSDGVELNEFLADFLALHRPASPSRESLFELISSLKEEVLSQSQQIDCLKNRNETMAEKVST